MTNFEQILKLVACVGGLVALKWYLKKELDEDPIEEVCDRDPGDCNYCRVLEAVAKSRISDGYKITIINAIPKDATSEIYGSIKAIIESDMSDGYKITAINSIIK